MRNAKLQAIVLFLTLTACTPIQLDKWESMTNVKLPQETKRALESLPDVPAPMPNGLTIQTDGTVSYPQPDPSWKCVQWFQTSLDAGWTINEWPKLGRILHRESRCNIDSFNRSDPNGGSRGLGQVNGYWCQKNKYNPTGFLQAKGVLQTCEDLFQPFTNLRAMRVIFEYGVARHGSGWGPWGG